MTDLERLMIEHQCQKLMFQYCRKLDERDVEGFLAIYTEDAVWARTNAPPIVQSGREAIRAMFRARPTAMLNRHLTLNPQVEVLGPDDAEGFCVGLIVDGPAGTGELPVDMRGVELLVEYRDRYRRTPDGWRIARRDMTRVIDRKSTPPAT